MFVDYISLLLINMAAGLVVLALYIARGIEAEDQKSWVPAFGAAGLVALLVGLHMTLTWPIPKLEKVNLTWANVAFGELSVLLGVLFLATALALWRGWSLRPLAVYAAFAATASIVVGIRILDLSLTKNPTKSGIGFILTGASGVLLIPALWCPQCSRPLRWLVAAGLIVAAALWGSTGYDAYWSHLQSLSSLPK